MAQNHIIHGIFIGDIDDAMRWKGNILCVLETPPSDEPKHAVVIPILRSVASMKELVGMDAVAMIPNLDLVAHVIQNHVNAGEELLVHCYAGMERSPLAVMWYLHSKMGLDLDSAYDYVKKRRPQTMNRLEWLNITSNKEE